NADGNGSWSEIASDGGHAGGRHDECVGQHDHVDVTEIVTVHAGETGNGNSVVVNGAKTGDHVMDRSEDPAQGRDPIDHADEYAVRSGDEHPRHDELGQILEASGVAQTRRAERATRGSRRLEPALEAK
ncbi:hypothetical protein PF010_g33274, partial [Phytophthora fragariae]